MYLEVSEQIWINSTSFTKIDQEFFKKFLRTVSSPPPLRGQVMEREHASIPKRIERCCNATSVCRPENLQLRSRTYFKGKKDYDHSFGRDDFDVHHRCALLTAGDRQAWSGNSTGRCKTLPLRISQQPHLLIPQPFQPLYRLVGRKACRRLNWDAKTTAPFLVSVSLVQI